MNNNSGYSGPNPVIWLIAFLGIAVLFTDTETGSKIACTSVSLILTVILYFTTYQKSDDELRKEQEENRRIKYSPLRKEIISLQPDKWKDRTGRIIKVPFILEGLYHKYENKWLNYYVIFSYRENTYTKELEQHQIEKYKRKFMDRKYYEYDELSPIYADYKTNRIMFFFYNGVWFASDVVMDKNDAKSLVDASELYESEKLKKDIERAKTRLDTNTQPARVSIPEDVQIFVWNRDHGKCVNCKSNEKLEFDHIIPISKGGSNTARNLQLLCEKCNRQKSNKIGY